MSTSSTITADYEVIYTDGGRIDVDNMWFVIRLNTIDYSEKTRTLGLVEQYKRILTYNFTLFSPFPLLLHEIQTSGIIINAGTNGLPTGAVLDREGQSLGLQRGAMNTLEFNTVYTDHSWINRS